MNLIEIQQPIQDYLFATDQILKRGVSNKNSSLIKKINQFTPIFKGKKIRSTLLFLLSGLNCTLDEDLPYVAASIEMLHLSSLIHDDVVDNSEFRRGEKTVNNQFGNFVSVLWGDFIFTSALDILVQSKKDFVIKNIIKIAKSMAEGQLLEAENTFNYELSEEIYNSIVEKKTSAIFAGISEIVSNLDLENTEAGPDFLKFGMNFGFMFQLMDDLLDLFSENSGKDRFRDLKEGKITYPLILLLKSNNSKILKSFSDKNQQPLLNLLEELKIQEQVLEKISEYSTECLEFLSSFSDSVYKESLIKLLRFVKNRDY